MEPKMFARTRRGGPLPASCRRQNKLQQFVNQPAFFPRETEASNTLAFADSSDAIAGLPRTGESLLNFANGAEAKASTVLPWQRHAGNFRTQAPRYDDLVAVDPSCVVAPTARIHPEATVGPRTSIGEFCVIEQDVGIGACCVIEPYCFIKRWTTMGDRNEISAGTVLGTDPLDKTFGGGRSYLRIGADNRIREHYTISRGTRPESVTTVGDGNYIMTSGHIAHNCAIGNNTVIASCALVAGYAELEDQAFISGGVVIHQFSKIGRLAMIGGNTRVNTDVPPFFLCSGFDAAAKGLNLVGLKRAGFTLAQVSALKKAYRMLYRSGLKLEEALTRIENELPDDNTLHLVHFIRRSERGICRE
jgi:UDP-N-acetylglucosamine acyltransferase